MRTSRLLLVLLMAACIAPWAHAQSEDAVQRARIAQERRDAEAEFVQREFDCSKRFAVTSCMDKAKSERRAKVDSLRRQEEVLDGNERRHRAAERLEAIRIKTEAQAKLKPVRPATAASASPEATSAADAASGGLLPVPGSVEANNTTPDRAKAPPKHSPLKAASPGKGAVVADHAAERAAAAQRRQDAVVKQSEARAQRAPSTKTPAAPLPPRPAIPPASSPGS